MVKWPLKGPETVMYLGAENEVLWAEVARLREALEKVWGYAQRWTRIEGTQPANLYCPLCKRRHGSHEAACPFTALSTPTELAVQEYMDVPGDDWLAQHDAEVKGKVWQEIMSILDDHRLPGWDFFVDSVVNCIKEADDD